MARLRRALVLCLSQAAVGCTGGDAVTVGSSSLSASQGLPTTSAASSSSSTGSTGQGESESGSSGTTEDTTTTTTTTQGTTSLGTTSLGTTSLGTTSSDTDPTGGDACKTELKVTIRDFTSAHPDFESYTGDKATTGLVKTDLGGDDKPVYANPGPTPQTSGPDNFLHWYNDTVDQNQRFEISIELTESMPGVFTYDNSEFFPIDEMGFGNEGWPHNFLFTTEIHANFKYEGGEVFTFTGDDDLWTFINGKLAIDLGGLHPPLSQTVDLDAMADALGISPGGTYPMDIFHAERHTDQSNFRIDTSIQCFIPQ
ncbi:MAG TPA: fibro-slime domain-containing protein [Nannocystis exedens]|nr:fibro-slime domain-containing protein [Nannocystis exedens]